MYVVTHTEVRRRRRTGLIPVILYYQGGGETFTRWTPHIDEAFHFETEEEANDRMNTMYATTYTRSVSEVIRVEKCIGKKVV